MLKPTEDKTTYFYVDEAGDPNFYAKGSKKTIVRVGEDGCSNALILGYATTENPDSLRGALADLREEIKHDEYLREVKSIKKTLQAFHGNKDCDEVRMMVYKLLREHEFSCQMRVARKIESLFSSKYEQKQNLFYDDLVGRLFQNVLHKSSRNVICFAQRGNKDRQESLWAAIERSVDAFREKWQAEFDVDIEVYTSVPSEEPLLQVVDYANWALQRAFERGQMRYFNFLREKYELVVDEFDFAKYGEQPSNFYSREKNPFEIKKANPPWLSLD